MEAVAKLLNSKANEAVAAEPDIICPPLTTTTLPEVAD